MHRVQILTAGSADQQANMINDLDQNLMEEHNVSLVLVTGIYKLAMDDARQRNRHAQHEEGRLEPATPIRTLRG